MARFLHRLALGCWYTFAAVAVMLAVLLGLARLLLPFADRYRGEVEAWASAQLRQPVQVDAIDAAWQGFGPVLKLKGVRLLDRPGGRPVLQLAELRLAVGLLDSVRSAAIKPSGLQFVGVHLSLLRRPDGAVVLQGIQWPERTETDRGSAGSADWLLGLERLSLLDSEVVLLDRQTGGPPLYFSDVDLTLDNEGRSHRLRGSVNFPGQPERRIELVFEFDGSLVAPASWVGKLYLKGTDVPLAGWPVALPGAAPVAGSADFELWVDWRGLYPVRLEGAVGVSQLALSVAAGQGGRIAVDQAQGQVLWLREESGWRFDINRFNFKRGGRSWPEGRIGVAIMTDAEGRLVSARGHAGFLSIEDVAALAQPFVDGRLRTFLAEARPYGELRDLELGYKDRGMGEVPAFSLQARFMQVGGQAWEQLPALGGLSGTLKADENSGTLVLDSRMARVEFPRLFRHPIEAAVVSGRLGWERGDAGWRLYSDELVANNADLRTRTRLSVDIPLDGGQPFLDMQTAFEEGNVSHVYRYLPVGIMPPEVVRWLDRSLVSGRVPSGTLLFHGHPKNFPFDRGTGKFEVGFQVADAVLDYEAGWPRLEELEAEVVFSGHSMTIRAVGGKIYNADLMQAEAAIPDLRHARLKIDGQVRGPVTDMLRVLREGPLAARYGGYLEGVRAEGGALLNLGLDLVLRKGGEHRVSGGVDLRNATLAADHWNLALTQLNGPVTFSDAGLAAKAVNARLFGQPVRIQVDTVGAGTKRPLADVRVSGPNLMALAKQFQISLPATFQGTAAWEARVKAPAGSGGWGTESAELVLTSDLKGVAMALPQPLGKSKEQPQNLAIRLPLTSAATRVVSIRYGDLLGGRLEVGRSRGGVALRRGELRFGADVPDLPHGTGLRITGRVPQLSLDAWSAWLGEADGKGRGPGMEVSLLDLEFGRLEAFGHLFENQRIAAQRAAAEWAIRAEGADATGVIRMPYPLADGARVIMDFEQLRLRAVEGDENHDEADPRRVPALQITCRRFVFGGSDFGSLEMRTSPRPEGMHLDQLLLQSPVLQVKVQGDWTLRQGRQSSSFAIVLDSTDLAKSMNLLGYAAAVEGSGPGHAEINATWPGAPAAFAFERLDGQLYMKLGKGRFLEVEPGVGRAFGLLSLQALPRRLSLDFSDLFKKGFAFDRIEGHFRIVDGDAYTHDLYMDGPSAHVEVVGRTGLASRKFDQIVTVTPHVGSSLPLAGALAGGPGIGVALLLAEKLFRSQIDQATRVQYTITGSWDDPVIERVQVASEDRSEFEH